MSRLEWFDSLFQKHGDMIFRYCALHTTNLQDAQDMYQEVFLKLYQKHPSFKDGEHAKAWLLRVSVNMCKNYHRSKFLHPFIEYDDALHVVYESKEQYPEILNTLQKLPNKYRSVVYLHYFEGYTLKEISRLLNRKETTIRTWLFRSKKQLQEILQEDKLI